ncbi:Pup--protein ligase [Actinomyces bowdenii]|uniref:Pup--protein ligase n=1 Tax=Actinomyces bowdenii TaxID=131109 RepID=UPI00214C29DE|nr:Pup--protein ligase [Actinomyces bowdenii]MCR2051843.1 Pup--protein ligase [Actinomyces bowdenii]
MSGSRPTARRIIGIETEYGITCASGTAGPPPMDADQAARALFDPIIQRGRSSNVFTRSGGRLYLDVGSHPEYATAECDRLEDLLAQDRAGDLIMADLADQANARLEDRGVTGRIHLLKNNLDAEGNGFGCHENYLVRRSGSFWQDAQTLVPHLVTRQILVGAGHIAPDARGRARYCFSQRADQTWEALSAATTRARPMINTRDEPHADAERYRRMHIIVGDSSIAQGSTLLKAGAMDLLLDYLESGGDLSDLALAEPMRAIREVSSDLRAAVALELADGRTITPVDLQHEHLERVTAHVQAELDLTGMQRQVLDLWGRGLEAVRSGRYEAVAAELDWAAKLRLLTRYTQRTGARLDDPRVARLALAYHDVTSGEGLRPRLERAGLLRRYIDQEACRVAVTQPPATTRARLRGAAVARAEDLRLDLSVDWVSLRLDDGVCRPVSLTDPFRAVDERVDALLEAMDDRGLDPGAGMRPA